MEPEVFELQCAVQNYHWGKKGSKSEVVRLKQCSDSEFSINEDEKYAELWMGDHPSGMSFICQPGKHKIALCDWLTQHPSALGGDLGGSLPYLLKVLSVNMALSIQAHPDKTLAAQLHKEFPKLYKDPNHKPEMAIALTPFEALCGFRPIAEIVSFLQNIPEFANVVGAQAVKDLASNQSKQQLKIFFTAFMSADESIVKQNLDNLITRINKLESEQADTSTILGSLVTRLNSNFPGDVGCFGVYLFNYLQLEPGQALYLGANVPHAYLYGDCVECMACSDNVVRAGLTPKFKDVPTLCSMLTYECKPAQDQIFTGTSTDQYTKVWRPPVPDFALAQIQIPAGVTSYTLPAVGSASIVLTVRGSAVATTHGLTLSRGKVVFISAGNTVPLDLHSSSEPVLMFRAFSNVQS